MQLTVVANPNVWEANTKDSWLHLSEKTVNTIMLTADDNPDSSERKGSVLFTTVDSSFELKVTQMPADNSFARYRQLLIMQEGAVISPNGKYAGGFYATLAEDKTVLYQPVIINLETDEWIMPDPLPVSLVALWSPAGITDEGMIIYDTEGGGPIAVYPDGNSFRIETPEGLYGTPSINNVVGDGSWVGFCMKLIEGKNTMYRPVQWIDKVGRELPMPEKNYRDGEFVNGAMARSASADGKIITGTTWDNMDFGMIYWNENREVFYVGKDFRKVKPVKRVDGYGVEYDFNLVDGITCMAGPMQVSPNGRWIAGTYRSEELGSDRQSIEEEYHAAFYNTETEKVYLFTDYGDSSGRGVSDDGLGFINMGHELCTTGVVVDIESGTELGTASEWVLENYGIVVPDGYLRYKSADGKILFGVSVVAGAMGPEDCYWYVAPALEK